MNSSFLRELLLPFAGTSLGAACVFFIKGRMPRTVQRFLMGFAAGVMVAASIFSLLLPASGWAEGVQSVAAEGVTADNHVLVSAAPESRSAWNDAEVYCSGQAQGTLSFTCTGSPTEDISANVVILLR